MLSANKPLMQQKFANMLMDNSGLFYKAAYNAQYKMLENDHKRMVNGFSSDNAFNTPNGRIAIDKPTDKWEESSKVFAKEFVKALRDGNFDQILADEIDNHIKSMELMITMQPQGIATIISPMGPCSGSMIISKATANVQIL